MVKPSDSSGSRDPYNKVANKILNVDAADEPRVIRELEAFEKESHPTDDDTVEIVITTSWKKKIPRTNPPSLISLEPTLELAPAISHFSKFVHHVTKRLGFNDILTCRLVCRSWLIAVDNLLENNLTIPTPLKPSTSTTKNVGATTAASTKQLQPQPSLFLNCRIHTSFAGRNHLEGIHLLDTATLKMFLEKMATHERNPFVGRCVRFGNYGETDHNAAYWDNCLEILRQFGHYIWFVELSDGHVSVPNPLTCYRLIRQCLMQLPNLRSLEISFANENISKDKVNELVMFMRLNPLPPLKKLEKLDWNEDTASRNVQDVVINTYSKQLKAFACPITVFKVKVLYAFPNLRHLYITNVKTNEDLSSLLFCKLPSLKMLYMNLGGERCTDCGDLCNLHCNVLGVLELVKKFQLQFLSLFLAPGGKLVDNVEGSKPFSLKDWNLNCLKSFEVQHCVENQYEFLKCFTALERIHFFDIHHPVFPERNASSVVPAEGNLDVDAEGSSPVVQIVENDALEIQKFIYDRKMEESNIWEVLPTLLEITFKCTWDRDGKNLIDLQERYTRESWEKKRNQKMTGMMDKVVAFVRSVFTLSFY